ncbi:hypothetical protein PRUB_a4775 [Pseudoalteromonas rubra]|uniref:Uncharacterized protein n=1 Tax=Pseudoalteromonas rubra TaxID=43658 RepID=A0A8T0C9P6_9GAMM|nr:hypothetical protein PRUB_a4775 [Pseudoalteromonas rubra]
MQFKNSPEKVTQQTRMVNNLQTTWKQKRKIYNMENGDSL